MKKISAACFTLGIVLFVLGLSACDGTLSASGDGGGLFNKPGSSGSGGQVVITGIDAGLYGTYQVYVHSSSNENSYMNSPAASGSVTIKGSDETVNLSTGPYASPWNGTGPYYVFIADNSGKLAAKSGESLHFAEGRAAISVSKLTVTGRLTITGIPSGFSNTYQVYVHSSNSESGYKTSPAASGSVIVSGSTAAVDLYPDSSDSRWNGTGPYYVFIVDSSGQLAVKSGSQVSFSNGSADITASSLIMLGRLTVTNIPSTLYGTYDIYVNSGDSNVSYSTNAAARADSVTFDRSTVTVDLYNTGSSSRWNAGGTYYIYLRNRSTSQLDAKSGPISFSNGSAEAGAGGFIMLGRLTINNIPSTNYDRYRIYAHSSGSESGYTTGMAAYNTSVSINGSTAAVDLYTDGRSLRWGGTGPYYVFLVDNSGRLAAKSGLVSFSNGSAVINANNLTPVGLTITGITMAGNITVYVKSPSDNTTYTGATVSGSVTVNGSTGTAVLSTGSSLWNATGAYDVFLADNNRGTVVKAKAVSFIWGTATVGFGNFQ
jgi:hypothetical protein